jgi:hypothetical protein
VSFSIPNFDTSPTRNVTVTVWTVNSGGNESNRANDSATPYGDTLTPTGMSGNNNGTTGATWSWNLPENGRPIDQVQIRGADSGTFGGNKTQHTVNTGPGSHTLEVRAHSAAGWSGWASRTVNVPNPQPAISNVHKGNRYVPPNGVGSCATNPCPSVRFDISNFAPNSSWRVTAFYRAGSVSSSVPLVVNGSGNGYTWNTQGLVVADGNGPLFVRLCPSGGGGCAPDSPSVAW